MVVLDVRVVSLSELISVRDVVVSRDLVRVIDGLAFIKTVEGSEIFISRKDKPTSVVRCLLIGLWLWRSSLEVDELAEAREGVFQPIWRVINKRHDY